MRRHMRNYHNDIIFRSGYTCVSGERIKEKNKFKPHDPGLTLHEAAHQALPYGSFSTDWTSVEIECYFLSNGIRLIPFTKSHSDGSIESPEYSGDCDCDYPDVCDCNSRYTAREYIACFPYPRLGILERLTKKLARIGAETNASCGLHVHLDVRHLDDNQFNVLVDKFYYFLPTLMVCSYRSSRWSNAYCKLGVGWHDRYYAINATSRSKHGTLEIRIHHGSVNFKEITNWVSLLNWIKGLDFDLVQKYHSEMPYDMWSQLIQLGLPDNLQKYIEHCEKYNATLVEANFYLNENQEED